MSRGLTQEELGEMVDANKDAIQYLEMYAIPPRLDRAYKIARVLGCEVQDIWPPKKRLNKASAYYEKT